MKIVAMEDVTGGIDEYLKLARGKDLLVTRKNKAAAIIQPMTEDDLAELNLVNDPRFKKVMKKRHANYLKHGAISAEQAKRNLGL